MTSPDTGTVLYDSYWGYVQVLVLYAYSSPGPSRGVIVRRSPTVKDFLGNVTNYYRFGFVFISLGTFGWAAWVAKMAARPCSTRHPRRVTCRCCPGENLQRRTPTVSNHESFAPPFTWIRSSGILLSFIPCLSLWALLYAATAAERGRRLLCLLANACEHCSIHPFP